MSTASQLKEIGKAEGIEKGIEQTREEIARNLGLSLEQVERYLSRQQ